MLFRALQFAQLPKFRKWIAGDRRQPHTVGESRLLSQGRAPVTTYIMVIPLVGLAAQPPSLRHWSRKRVSQQPADKREQPRVQLPTLGGGKRLLGPAGVAWISGVKLRITRRSSAIDKQCALNASRGRSTLQYSCII